MPHTPRLWHVIVTVAGAARTLDDVHDALERLRTERPFIDSVRFAEQSVELCYWEEAAEVVDAASLALRLWNEHRASADLPPWNVVGLEVVEREAFLARQQGNSMPYANAAAQPL